MVPGASPMTHPNTFPGRWSPASPIPPSTGAALGVPLCLLPRNVHVPEIAGISSPKGNARTVRARLSSAVAVLLLEAMVSPGSASGPDSSPCWWSATSSPSVVPLYPQGHRHRTVCVSRKASSPSPISTSIMSRHSPTARDRYQRLSVIQTESNYSAGHVVTARRRIDSSSRRQGGIEMLISVLLPGPAPRLERLKGESGVF